MIRYYRTMHGNNVVDNNEFVRGLLMAMKAGEVVGLLMDTNMTSRYRRIICRFLWYPTCTQPDRRELHFTPMPQSF